MLKRKIKKSKTQSLNGPVDGLRGVQNVERARVEVLVQRAGGKARDLIQRGAEGTKEPNTC